MEFASQLRPQWNINLIILSQYFKEKIVGTGYIQVKRKSKSCNPPFRYLDRKTEEEGDVQELKQG